MAQRPVSCWLIPQTNSRLLIPDDESITDDDSIRLFTHFFEAFSNIFGCSNFPPAAPTSTSGSNQTLSLAYVHKYMNLNYTDLGYFIDQLCLATTQYGFSEQDSQTLNTNLNSDYNAKCIPPVTLNPAIGPELLSRCQADNCPLAEPNPDCAAYVNLTADGIASAPQPSGQTVTVNPATTPTAFTPTTVRPTSTNSILATAAQFSSVAHSTSAALGPSAIAGIAIGGCAVLLLGVVAIIFTLRRRRPVELPRSYQPTVASSSMPSPPGEQKIFTDAVSPTLSHHFSSVSEMQGQSVAEMD